MDARLRVNQLLEDYLAQHRFRRAAAVAAAAILTAAGVVAALPVTDASADTEADRAVTRHVIVISIDGLRPDAIERYDARVLRMMMREGSYSLQARTISPSKTLPAHTSMLTGLPPSVHGVTWNQDRTDERGYIDATTVFETARAQGLGTAAFFSKAKLRHLQKPGSLDHAQSPGGLTVYTAAETVEQATRYLRFRRPNLLFIHLSDPDIAGHTLGWLSFAYGWAVRRADGGVGQILRAADETYGRGNYSVIVTSDHGGHGRTHGTEHEDDMLIPWLAWGAGVASTGAIARPINTMDTAATVLWLLGLSDRELTGRVVMEAFTPAARLLAAGAAQTTP